MSEFQGLMDFSEEVRRWIDVRLEEWLKSEADIWADLRQEEKLLSELKASCPNLGCAVEDFVSLTGETFEEEMDARNWVKLRIFLLKGQLEILRALAASCTAKG